MTVTPGNAAGSLPGHGELDRGLVSTGAQPERAYLFARPHELVVVRHASMDRVNWEDWPVRESARRQRARLSQASWLLLGFLLGGALFGGLLAADVGGLPVLLLGIVVLGLFLLTIFLETIP